MRRCATPRLVRHRVHCDPAVPHTEKATHLAYAAPFVDFSPVDLKHEETTSTGYVYTSDDGITPAVANHVDTAYGYEDSPGKLGDMQRAGLIISEERNASRHKSSGHFERPQWKRLAVHTIACICVYPVVLLICLLANHRSIWWARFIVGVGSGVLGFALSINLLEFAKRHLEASTWATILHKSNCDDVWTTALGVPVADLAMYTKERNSVYSALRLLAERNMPNTAYHGKLRRSYDNRPWTLFILFYLSLACFCSLIPFIFGRIIIINPFIAQQHNDFDETFVWGDLSDKDINASSSLGSTLMQSSEWTLVPFASLTDYPPSVSFEYNGSTVYFVDVYEEQLRTDGTGLGTFQLNGTIVDARGTRASQNLSEGATAESEYVQFPRWGIRMYCDLLPDPDTYMVPISTDSFTYIFVPDDFLSELSQNLNIPLPDMAPANFTAILSQNDTVPSGVDPDKIPMLGKFYNNGVTHSFFSKPADKGSAGDGWLQVEVVLIRINMTYTPNGSFPLSGAEMPDIQNNPTFVGYDAAVCIEAYEPWIVEVYNATGIAPTLTRIVGKGASMPIQDGNPLGGRMRHGLTIEGVDVQRAINSTGKMGPFGIAHDNSIAQMLKDNGRDFWYQPSPLAVSFTDGAGPGGYTKLSPSRYAQARSQADATNVLPFLAGTEAVVARVYPSRTLSSTSIDVLPLVIVNIGLFIFGLIACLCVPKLPLGVPRRGFDLLSWLAVLHEDNVIGQIPILPNDQFTATRNKSSTDDIEGKWGDVYVRYKV